MATFTRGFSGRRSRLSSCPARPFYVCGSSDFADAASDLLLSMDVAAGSIRWSASARP